MTKELTQRLTGDYFTSPMVTVSIAEFRKYYVSGEVKVQMASPMSRGLPSRNLLRRRVDLQIVLTEKISTFACQGAISCLRMSI